MSVHIVKSSVKQVFSSFQLGYFFVSPGGPHYNTPSQLELTRSRLSYLGYMILVKQSFPLEPISCRHLC